MNTYFVKLEITCAITVDARSEKEAREKAMVDWQKVVGAAAELYEEEDTVVTVTAEKD